MRRFSLRRRVAMSDSCCGLLNNYWKGNSGGFIFLHGFYWIRWVVQMHLNCVVEN